MELTDPLRRNFPSTVTVLAVDSDIEHLLNLTTLLRCFNYQFATCQTATGALSLLRKRTNDFQILLADVALPDTDGFDLLTAARSEFPALQVVLFSDAEYETSAVQALTLGACAFYTKPIQSDVVEHVWQNVFRRKVESLPPPPLPIVSAVGPAPKWKRDDDLLNSSVITAEGKRGKRLKKAAGGSRKPRLVWTPELHSKFVDAVEFLGSNNLTSGKILKVMKQMGVVSLSEPQVSSHLQQYRKTLLISWKNKSLSAAVVEIESSLEPSSSYKETSAAQNQTTPSADIESYLSELDYITSSQQSSQATSYVESGGEEEDFDWCLNLDDLSFLEKEAELITNLLACC